MNLGPARLFLGIETHHDVTWISLGQKACITIIFRQFRMEHTHGVAMPMNLNVKLDLAEDQGEKKLDNITDNQAVMESLMYLATQPDISCSVAALSGNDSWPFTSHMTTAKWVLQCLKSTADFCLHVNYNGIDINIGNSLVGYSDSAWANNSANRKSQGGHMFPASNGAISGQSRKQSLIAMSILKAEFIA